VWLCQTARPVLPHIFFLRCIRHCRLAASCLCTFCCRCNNCQLRSDECLSLCIQLRCNGVMSASEVAWIFGNL
jgi:hypothetical protein